MDTMSIILLILALSIAAIPSFTEVIVRNRGINIRNVTGTGWILILLCILFIILQLIQSKENKTDDARKNYIYNAKLNSLSVKSESFLLKNNESLIKGYTTALNKYYLHYDSTQNSITSIIKALPNQNNVMVETKPEIYVTNIVMNEIGHSSVYRFRLDFDCNQNPAFKVNLKVNVAEYGTFYQNTKYRIASTTSQDISNGMVTSRKALTFDLTVTETAAAIYYLIFYIHGTYTDIKDKKYNYQQVLSYRMGNGEWTNVAQPFYQDAISFFHSKGVN